MIKTVIITMVTTVCLFVSNSFYKTNKEITETNRLIGDISLGETKSFVDHLLGNPRFEFADNDLNNAFYPLKHVVIRCVFDEKDSLVGFFITAKEKKYKIVFGSLFSSDPIKEFGRTNFDV